MLKGVISFQAIRAGISKIHTKSLVKITLKITQKSLKIHA